MTLSIRPLALDDAPALQSLLESVPGYAERITGSPPAPSDALTVLTSVPLDFDPGQKQGIGLWDGEQLVAFGDLLLGYPEPETAYIGLLVVHGKRQGEGLGRVLHDRILRRVHQELPIIRVRLGLVATNAAAAEPFWSALGYWATGESKPYRHDQLTSTVALWERPIERTR